jgi:hypothetical protein
MQEILTIRPFYDSEINDAISCTSSSDDESDDDFTFPDVLKTTFERATRKRIQLDFQ